MREAEMFETDEGTVDLRTELGVRKLDADESARENKVFETWPAPGSVVRDPVTGGLFEV